MPCIPLENIYKINDLNIICLSCLLFHLTLAGLYRHAPFSPVNNFILNLYNHDKPMKKFHMLTKHYYHTYVLYSNNVEEFVKCSAQATLMTALLSWIILTGPNPTDRGRNGSKISVITTADRVVIGYSFAGATKH